MALYLDHGDAANLLDNWVELNSAVMALPINPILQLLEMELTGRRRPQVVGRLHQRFNKLRAREERERLARGEVKWRYL